MTAEQAQHQADLWISILEDEREEREQQAAKGAR